MMNECKWKKITAMILCFFMIGNLAACGSTTATNADSVSNDTAFAGATEEEMVVLDITAEPLELNSMMAYDTTSMDILSHCMSGLTKLDENDQPIADLAEKWDINEAQTEYILYLRKDAKWSNGDSVVADDFYYAWVTQMKQETGSLFASYLYENIKNGEAFYKGEADETQLGIEVIDDHTIKIIWERPMTDGLFLLALSPYLPMNQKAYEEIGADTYAKDAGKFVTNGAYELTEWIHDDHIMLEKWDAYYDAANINIPKVKLVMIGDENTRLNAFLTGEIDLCNLYSEQISQVKEKDGSALHSYFDGGSWYLGFNMENEYLSNENLRKALSYSIDIQSLLDNVIADGSVAADGLVPHTIAGIDGKSYAQERGGLFVYDLEKSKEYMNQAMKELAIIPSDLKLTLDVANTSYSQNQAVYIQQQWKKNLGIDVTINAQTWNAIQDAKLSGDFNISVEANSATDNSPMSFLSTYISENASNIFHYKNTAYDKLMQAALQESDPSKKQDIMIQAEKILIDEAIVGPLYYTCTTYALSGKLKGVVRTPFQTFNVCLGATISTE